MRRGPVYAGGGYRKRRGLVPPALLLLFLLAEAEPALLLRRVPLAMPLRPFHPARLPLELEGLLGLRAGAGFLWTVPRLPPGPLGILPAGWTPGRLYRWTKVQAPPRRQEPLPNLSVLRLGAEGMAAHLQAPLRLPLIHAHPEGVGKPDRQPRIAAFPMKLSSLHIGLARSADNQGGRLLTVPGAGRSPGPRPDYQPGRVFRSAL